MKTVILILLFTVAGSLSPVEIETRNVPFVLEAAETSAKCLDIINSITTLRKVQAAPEQEKSACEVPKFPKNCHDILTEGDTESGIKTVYPYRCCPHWGVRVFCDQDTDGGGWTTIQKRENLPVREDFYRTWKEYVLGFGNLTGEHWLGLDNIHALTSTILMELKILLQDSEKVEGVANYGFFAVGDAQEKYALSIENYSGDAGDSLTLHNGMKFSTKDQDNDIGTTKESCAETYKGGWWYEKCHYSNLNGYQHLGNTTSYADGIVWYAFRGYYNSMEKARMMVRPAFKN